MAVVDTKNYVQDEQLLNKEFQLIKHSAPTAEVWKDPAAGKIYNLCADIKQYVVHLETGVNSIGDDFEAQGLTLGDTRVDHYIDETPDAAQNWEALQAMINEYNKRNATTSISSTIFDAREVRTKEALHGLIRIQRAVLANEMGR
jgi:hypothetical protein